MAKRWKTCVDLRANLISTKVSASHHKSTQVHASSGQTESQVDAIWKLGSTCYSVWPGLYFIYCVSVWGSTYQSNLSRVSILQNKIIRIICKVSFDSHTDVLFKEHGILKFFDIYFYQIGKFMYLFKRGLLPNYFRNMFTLASQLHSHYTRNCNLYYIPPCRTNIRNFSIRFQGPKFFNSLSPEIQNSESIRLFGRRLKKFLLS